MSTTTLSTGCDHLAVLDVSDTERSGFLARQPDRPQRLEAPKRAGHGGWTGQAGGFRIGPHLRRSHGSHFSGEWQFCLHIL